MLLTTLRGTIWYRSKTYRSKMSRAWLQLGDSLKPFHALTLKPSSQREGPAMVFSEPHEVVLVWLELRSNAWES